jgi:hypothetical protein
LYSTSAVTVSGLRRKRSQQERQKLNPFPVTKTVHRILPENSLSVNKFPAFKEPGSSRKPVPESHPKPLQSSPHLHTLFLQDSFHYPPIYTLVSHMASFFGNSRQMSYKHLSFAPIQPSTVTHPTLLDLIALVTWGKQKVLSFGSLNQMLGGGGGGGFYIRWSKAGGEAPTTFGR